MKATCIVYTFAVILLWSVSFSSECNAIEVGDVVSVINNLSSVLKSSSLLSLKKVAQSCEEFLEEYYQGSAHIRFLSESMDFSERAFFDPHSNSIYVRSDLSGEELALTVIHELTHYQQNTRDTLAFRIITGSNEKNPTLSARVLELESESFSNSLDYYNKYISQDMGDLIVEYRKSKKDNCQVLLPEWQRTLAIYALAKENKKDLKFLSILYN